MSDLLGRLCSDIEQPGNRFPIGCGIIAESIYPTPIGSDIGRGIVLYPLGHKPSYLTPDRGSTTATSMDHGMVVHRSGKD